MADFLDYFVRKGLTWDLAGVFDVLLEDFAGLVEKVVDLRAFKDFTRTSI